MFLVNKRIRDERLSICQACKWYKSESHSCGPLRPQNLLGASEVEVDADESLWNKRHYNKKVKLCGCNMKLKTNFSFAECPAGKWTATSEKPTKVIEKGKEMKQFFLSLKKASKIEGEDLKRLFRYISEVEGRVVPTTTCAPCVIDWIKRMNEHFEKIHFED